MFDFSVVDEAVFAEFGRAATYTPQAGAPVAVTVVLDQPVETAGVGALRGRVPATRIRLRKSEVAAPKRGDSVTIAAQTYKVESAPVLDAEGLVWTVGLEKQ